MEDYTFNFEEEEKELSKEVVDGTDNESTENNSKVEEDVKETNNEEVESEKKEDETSNEVTETKTETDEEIEKNTEDNSTKKVVEDERDIDTGIDELKEIEDIIAEAINNENEDSTQNQSEVLKKANNLLSKAIKDNENLKLELATLRLNNNRDDRPDEIIVLQHNWSKAKSGDNESINKIKQVLLDSLNLRLDSKKDIILSNEIINSRDSIDVDTSDILDDLDVSY